MVRPEQSNRRGPTAPHWYGAPRLVAAMRTALRPAPAERLGRAGLMPTRAETLAWAGAAATEVTPISPTATIRTMTKRPSREGDLRAAQSKAFMGGLQGPLARHDLSGSGTCLPGPRDAVAGGHGVGCGLHPKWTATAVTHCSGAPLLPRTCSFSNRADTVAGLSVVAAALRAVR